MAVRYEQFAVFSLRECRRKYKLFIRDVFVMKNTSDLERTLEKINVHFLSQRHLFRVSNKVSLSEVALTRLDLP